MFASTAGTPLSAGNVRRAFRRVADAAGLVGKDWTPRELRHSFVSLLSDGGVSIEKIAQLVGHAGGSTVTERVYRHQLRPIIQDSAETIDRLFPGALPPATGGAQSGSWSGTRSEALSANTDRASDLVALIEALSNRSRSVVRLLELAMTWENSGVDDLPPVPSCRTARQLRPDEVDDLIEGYRAGRTVRELAQEFGVERRAVGRHLRARGVETKPPGLRPDDVPVAARLYESGWSLVRIGEKYGIADTTVRIYLLKAGVKMRQPHERA